MSASPLIQISELETSKKVAWTDSFRYEEKIHAEFPHVVKFSGGRSSGLMLFALLESGLLQAERGDVVVFNNTSAEHPETYKFTRQCKQIVEEEYGIPFLWVEFQTYEDAREGEWVRLPAYRLVNSAPWSVANPDGYHWKGEAFEELLSWRGYVPNQFTRICTATLKLQMTRNFLADWLAGKPATKYLGHHGNGSRMNPDKAYKRHLRNGGAVPEEIFFEKKKYLDQRPFFRPAQRFADFSECAKPFNNPHLSEKVVGNTASFGDNGAEYLAFVGLRADEERRVRKVKARNAAGPETGGYEGEHIYMPLFNMKVDQETVQAFWSAQSWDLKLDSSHGLSNCTYCFLKGFKVLKQVHNVLSAEANAEYKNTPCDLNWWIKIEEKYGRDLKAEKRKITAKVPNNFIGFFNSQTGFSYEKIRAVELDSDKGKGYIDNLLPCDCTD